MKKVIKTVSALLLIVLITVIMNNLFIPKYISENKDGRITREFYREKDNLDVIYLGSSTMYSDVSPLYIWNKYGITGFVRSNASQTLWQSYYLLKEALKKHKPSLIVLDMSFIKNGYEFAEEPSNRKALECIRNPFIKYEAVRASMSEGEDIVSYYLPVLRYHSRWKDLTKEDFKYVFSNPLVTDKGFLMDFSIAKEQNIYPREEIGTFEFPPKAVEYLDKIIGLCKENDLSLFLMKTPTFSNNWHFEYDEWLYEKAALQGMEYVNFDDFADDMGIEVRTDYVDDGSHLNIVGAEKFSDYLGSYIIRNYGDKFQKKTDETAERWNEDYKVYTKKRSDGIKGYEKLLDLYVK